MDFIENSTDIGVQVRRARKEAGLRQADAAALCGVGVRFLSDLENGKETAHLGKALQVMSRLGVRLAVQDRSSTAQVSVVGDADHDIRTHKLEQILHRYQEHDVVRMLIHNIQALEKAAQHPVLSGMDTIESEAVRLRETLLINAARFATDGFDSEPGRISKSQQKQIAKLGNLAETAKAMEARGTIDTIARLTNQLAQTTYSAN